MSRFLCRLEIRHARANPEVARNVRAVWKAASLRWILRGSKIAARSGEKPSIMGTGFAGAHSTAAVQFVWYSLAALMTFSHFSFSRFDVGAELFRRARRGIEALA